MFQTKVLITITGDLLKVKADAIVQQCNCVTAKAHGLSESIRLAFPAYGDAYGHRRPKYPGATYAISEDFDQAGTLRILCPPKDEDEDAPQGKHSPAIVCMLAQEQPSKPGRWGDSTKDTSKQREAWFAECLVLLEKEVQERKWTSIAFPKFIGCGLAGGNWKDAYLPMLESFADKMKALGVKCIMVALPSSAGKVGRAKVVRK